MIDVRAEDPSRERHRQVVLAEMQDRRAGGERHVRPVVDREQLAVPRSRRRELVEQPQFLAGLQPLLSQLHDVDPGAQDGIQEIGQIALTTTRIGAEVEAGVGQ